MRGMSAITETKIEADPNVPTIRIVRAVRLKFDGSRNPDAPPARNSRIRAADGIPQPAKLIEFQ